MGSSGGGGEEVEVEGASWSKSRSASRRRSAYRGDSEGGREREGEGGRRGEERERFLSPSVYDMWWREKKTYQSGGYAPHEYTNGIKIRASGGISRENGAGKEAPTFPFWLDGQGQTLG